jgi:uncharacterized protein (TIGR00730 family)
MAEPQTAAPPPPEPRPSRGVVEPTTPPGVEPLETPRRPARRAYTTGDAGLDARLMAVVQEIGAADPRLTFEMLVTAVKMAKPPLDRLDRKLINASLKEMRYAFGVFSAYRDRRKVTVFGSARVQPGDPDYDVARDFGRRIVEAGWMVITGAGPGIMRAGQEGAGHESSFGVNIVLPFENAPNEFIADDPKLINFKYFFTRKLMFIKEAEAFALFPGGYGTMDELFELLVLVQTGKSDLHPIVLLEREGGDYWPAVDRAMRDVLLAQGMIDAADRGFYHIAANPADAVAHIERFYRVYHSQRYVGEELIVRLSSPLDAARIAALNAEFADILRGEIRTVGASEPEIRDDDVVTLPRLSVPFDRVHFARLRRLIDRIND